MSGSSYYSQNDFRLHFGLGARRQSGHASRSPGLRLEGNVPGSARQSSVVIQETKGIVSSRRFG